MKINKGEPFWGFDHEKVLEKFKGTKFINEFTVGGYLPVAVYYSKDPDRSKGHTNYFYLFCDDFGQLMIGGMDADKMEQYKYQSGIHCKKCGDVKYSRYRHEMIPCSCGLVSVDGGKEYLKVSFKEDADYEIVKINLLTDEILPMEEKVEPPTITPLEFKDKFNFFKFITNIFRRKK